MPPPILATKLYIPPPRPNVVVRPRLIERLNEGLNRHLTLISAPAGFGKTTLVSEWVAAYEQLNPKVRAAWLSLDESDNDPTRFLTYLIAALQTIAPTIGTELLLLLQSPQLPTESLLTALLNEIAHLPERFILILDDYHLIDAKPIDEVLAFLVDHLPPPMHLVISTREDPNLRLARLRARGQLTELRARDLRFSPSEAADFLNRRMGLSLSAGDIAALEDRTEGWITGLQLAALSLQGQQDTPGFIRAFAGDHRYIVDYLVDEVLERLPEPVRSFLLQTAILDQLNGSLCDAVTGQQDGNERLDTLERGNFFVVPLDDQRHWYRYHHLFADVLSAHLMAEQPDQVARLHRRASVWYEQNDLPSEAIRYALLGEDFERAATLIELAQPAMSQNRQEAMLLAWLQALPDAVLLRRPVLCVTQAHVLLATGQIEGVEERLRDAERWIDAPAETRGQPDALAAGMTVVNDEAFRRLPGTVAIARAGLALARGDVPATMTYARRALEVALEDDYLTRGGASGFLGLAFWASGDLEAAHRTYAEGMASLKKAGNISDAINGAITLAAIRIAQGRLRQAMRTYEQALQLATHQDVPIVRGAADVHVGMSELHREYDDLHAATEHLLISRALGEHTGFPQNRYRWRVAMARILEAQGDLDGALDLLDEGERLYMSDFSPNVRPITALKTRVWVAQGRLDEALDWAREQGLSVEDDLSYVREFEHMTLSRVLLARSRSNRADPSLPEAMRLLDRLLKAAEAGERTRSVIEILVLQALAHQIRRDVPAALARLKRALTLAEPEGFVRVFVDEGPTMATLLETAAKQGIAPNYVRQLLKAFDHADDKTPVNQVLIDPLSERELAVLRLLGTDLSGPEIARQLIVSLSTLRTHTQNIYTKLGVNNRRAAVSKAEELNLF